VIHVNPDWRTRTPRFPEELEKWVASRPEATFYDIWDETINPEWLPYLAQSGGATKQEIVFAACAVARLALHLIPEGEDRPRIAIETSEAWAKGEATAEQVQGATIAAYHAVYAANAAAYAVYSAYSAYYAVYSAANTVTPAYAYAAAYAIQAGIESQLICATIRKHLVFERPPRPKRLTVWQRLAEGDE